MAAVTWVKKPDLEHAVRRYVRDTCVVLDVGVGIRPQQFFREGAALSYSAFVQQALADGVSRAREALLAESFLQASRDPEFLEDVDRALRDFGNADDGSYAVMI